MSALIPRAEAARMLGYSSEQGIRRLEGVSLPVQRDARNRVLYKRSDVERVKAERGQIADTKEAEAHEEQEQHEESALARHHTRVRAERAAWAESQRAADASHAAYKAKLQADLTAFVGQQEAEQSAREALMKGPEVCKRLGVTVDELGMFAEKGLLLPAQRVNGMLASLSWSKAIAGRSYKPADVDDFVRETRAGMARILELVRLKMRPAPEDALSLALRKVWENTTLERA